MSTILWKVRYIFLSQSFWESELITFQSDHCNQHKNDNLKLKKNLRKNYIPKQIAMLESQINSIECLIQWLLNSISVNGGFQLLDLIIMELKSHMTCWKSKVSHWWKFNLSKNPLQDLLFSLNAVISTNERHWIITGHVTFKLRYNQI